MTFAKTLKTLRKENGLTQTELAKIAGVSTSCISMIEVEQREPTAQTIVALSKALNVSTDYLLGIEDDLGNVVGELTLTKDEQRLIVAFEKLNGDLKEKIIEDAEFYAELNVVKK